MTRILLVGLLLLAGCNPVQRIATATNGIREEAQALEKHGTEIGDAEVVTRASRIDDLASGIHQDLPNVQNKPSELMDLLKWGAIAAVLIAFVVLLWQTGIGSGIKAVIGWIPQRTRNDAKLAASVLSEDKPENVREWIAAKRADPVWNRAFEEAQKETRENAE